MRPCKWCFHCPRSKTVVNNIWNVSEFCFSLILEICFLVACSCQTVMLLQDSTGTVKSHRWSHSYNTGVILPHGFLVGAPMSQDKDIPLTISNITHTVWRHTEMFNSVLILTSYLQAFTLSHRLSCTLKATFCDSYFYHVENETRHQQSIHTGSYLVRIKVQKHKLDNHQLGYSKFCLSWTGDFSGRTLIDWKCEVIPRSLTFEEFWFQCHSDFWWLRDLSLSSGVLGQV